VVGLALLAAAATPVAAQETYHVATTGNDVPQNGSAAAPWATIGYALGRVPDGSTVLVAPGTYHGRVDLRGDFARGVVVRSEVPYRARLRHTATVVTCFYGRGIRLEGFDIAHSGPGAGALVVQIQDLIGEPGGDERVSRIVLANNVLHDSFDNDVLKINNGASHVTVTGNVFYNQSGHDEHIDVNSVSDVVIRRNVFFNDFAGSGRTNGNDTGSFIVIKDSNGTDDGLVGAQRITVKQNVFLGWAGSTGSYFVLVGEDGHPYHEARDVLVESNLFLGNAPNAMRAAFGVKGASDVTFRSNTVVGDLPSLAFAMRLNREGANPRNRNVRFHDNLWADPTGTMGAVSAGSALDFSDTPPEDTESAVLWSNLYWNGGAPLPDDPAELLSPVDDAGRVVGDPRLRDPASAVAPRWLPDEGRFAGGGRTIARAFRKLVARFGKIGPESAALDAADPGYAAPRDVRGRRRGARPDIGAFER